MPSWIIWSIWYQCFSSSYGPVTSNSTISWPLLWLMLPCIRFKAFHNGAARRTGDSYLLVYIGFHQVPSRFDTNWQFWFCHPDLTLIFNIKDSMMRAVGRTGNTYYSTAPNTLLFFKGVLGFQALVPFVLSFSKFWICLVSFDHMVILHWTYVYSRKKYSVIF